MPLTPPDARDTPSLVSKTNKIWQKFADNLNYCYRAESHLERRPPATSSAALRSACSLSWATCRAWPPTTGPGGRGARRPPSPAAACWAAKAAALTKAEVLGCVPATNNSQEQFNVRKGTEKEDCRLSCWACQPCCFVLLSDRSCLGGLTPTKKCKFLFFNEAT